LIDFEGGGEGRNQLAWILDEYSRNPASRKSKWQATTYDPYRDVSSTAQLEFPCLQQVSFTFVRPNGLVVNAFYATQQILRKGYGNYLGLSRLGAFMAEEMGRSLARVNVFVGVAQMDNDIGKTSSLIEPVVESVRDVLRSESGRWAA
jgi:thymidylate synthase